MTMFPRSDRALPARSHPARRIVAGLTLMAAVALIVSACGPRGSGGSSLTVYSGRVEPLVGPILERFARETGTDVKVRYGDTAELAAAILEEGNNSPADVYFAQDAGALGAVANRVQLLKLPDATLNKVEARYRSPKGEWVGISGRARVVAYNPQRMQESQLPDSVLGFTDPRWRGRIGWAPSNGSFQAFVTALRHTEGEDATRRWLEGIRANDAKRYSNNIAIVQAVASGEIDVGLVNHYYLFALRKDQGSISAANYHPRDGKVGAMINVAGVGILASSKNQDTARKFVDFLLSEEAQRFFTTETFEYPLIPNVPLPEGAVPLSQIKSPNIDLSSLSDLDDTLRLLRETGVL
jgi:iron(III) transport system substrate-binding protein